jgi:hypothetical protein
MQPPRSNLADVVADRAVARVVGDLRVALARLHGDVRVVETEVELRAEFRGVIICRVVPYRELLHVQVGQNPTWETRLRSAGEFPDVMHRIVRAFLHAFARAQSGMAA